MADINKTTGDVTLYDENGNEVKVTLINGIYRIEGRSVLTNPDGTKDVTVTTDGTKERLDVDAHISDTPHKGKFISDFLRNGGSNSMIVNGSSTPQVFSASPPSGKKWFITRMLLSIEDTNMTWQKFGGISALTNGIEIEYTTEGSNVDLLSGETIKKNSELSRHCYDTDLIIGVGTVDLFKGRWTFSKSGTSLLLTNTDSDLFKITVNDNLTNLNAFRVIIQGYEVDE